jgi:tryptophan-rich sensory protein
MIYRLLIFLVLNFGALALGGLFTSKGVTSDWYYNLKIAPWTPPGWVFGFAWTTIMFCFSFYMAYLLSKVENKRLLIAIYVLQWILNVAWNPVFFYFHEIGLGLIVIMLLTSLVGFLFFRFRRLMSFKSIFIAPYFIWLLIATSLNVYLFLFN